MRVLDEHRLLVPEFPGNRRADSHRNLLENPRAAMLFTIPGLRETLRVAGRACITRDESLLANLAVDGRAPKLGIGLEVEEAFIHCAKALIRSGLWQPDTWPEELPSASAILRDHIDSPDVSTEQVAAQLRGELHEDALLGRSGGNQDAAALVPPGRAVRVAGRSYASRASRRPRPSGPVMSPEQPAPRAPSSRWEWRPCSARLD